MSNTDACTNACLNARCGDGFMQPGEACDDGNMSNTDGCTNACALPTCGDGVMQAGEQCDDGNMVDTDACLNSCMTARCGDMVAQMGVEECDDGNMVDTDACRNSCVNARCGDMVVQTGVEQCDDGNMSNLDTCTNACTTARCGDGFAQPGEQCDDGNMSNTDACTNACTTARCGDGFIGPGEACDDSNAAAGDGCGATCAVEGGYACMGAPSTCSPVCGDGMLVGAETCDQGGGNVANGDGCSATCQLESGWACSAALPSVCAQTCGNNTVDANEQCDDGNLVGGDGCSASCRFAIGCAAGETQLVGTFATPTPIPDNVLAGVNTTVMLTSAQTVSKLVVYLADLPHTFDADLDITLVSPRALRRDLSSDNGGSADNYTRTFLDDAAATAVTAGTAPFTGRFRPEQPLAGLRGQPADGTWTLNVADDLSGDAGTLNGWSLIACTSASVPRCGNGMVDAGEECDDGNDTNNDLCSNACQLTDGCGDGNLDAGEQCDDDNTASLDGCSAMCQVEINCPAGQVAVTVANNNMAAIPDNDQVTGVTRGVMVAQAGAITSMRVFIQSITHTFDADLDIFLVAPNGTQRALSTDNGSTGDNYTATIFDDSAPIAITAGTAPFTGPHRPQVSLATSQGVDFRRVGAAGTWNLRVFDDAAGDTGTFNGWTLLACVDPTSFCGDGMVNAGEECDDGNNVNGDACSNLCQIADGCGDGNIDGVEVCDDNNVFPGDGCSATCQPDIGCAAGQNAVVISAGPFMTPIPDNAGGLLSEIIVPNGGLVRRAIATVYIAHAANAHLDLHLMSPFGARRLLSDDQAGANYVSTIFSDAATTAITAGAAPYTGAFRPEATLDIFNNQSAAGSWLLHVGDDTTGTTGVFAGWTLALCVDPAATRVCGNGWVEATEQCDDANTANSDGCSATCQLELACAAGQNAVVVQGTDQKAIIQDNNSSGVTSALAVAGGGTVGKAVVVVNAIGHAFDGDLNLTLTSPMGTNVDVSSGNGSSGDDFMSTIFADSATTSINGVSSALAPFRGPFKPEAPLAAVNGQAATGMWTFKAADNANLDAGILRSWSLGLCVQP
jgi:cysteine-rich repeat protein